VRQGWLLVALMATVAVAQVPSELTEVLQQLQSPDNATRLQAMERTPKLGATLIPHLDPLLTHQDWRVQRAAQIVLETIAARATQPNAEDRREVVSALLALTKPDRPLPVRKVALHALSICATDDAVPSLATLLGDEPLRNEALATLKQIGSPAAAKVVANAAVNAKGSWLRDLLATLGEMGRPEGIPVLLTMLKSGDPETKAVAATALGRIGDAKTVATLADAVRQGVPTAFDALVRTGELLLQRGQVSFAADAFERAFQLAKDEHQRCAALLGLGKTGTEKALPLLVSALDAPEITVRQTAFDALVAYRRRDASRGLQEMWKRANSTQRVMLLRVFVARKEPTAPQLLRQSATDPNPEIRTTALTLMGELDDPTFEPVLWEAATKGSDAIKSVALRSYLSIAERRARKGETAPARAMFERALQLAEQNNLLELRDRALNGLALVGDPQSLPLIERYLQQPNPPRAALLAAVAIAETLMRQGKKTDATTLARRVLSLRPPRDVGNRASQVLVRLGEDPSAIPRSQGFLCHWWLLGPLPNPDNRAFDQAFIDETSLAPLRLETVRVDNRSLRWREIRITDPQGVVDLTPFFRQTEWVACYAYTEFVVDSDMDAELRLGSDDSVKVWLNGQLVHQFGGMRGLTVDQDRVRVQLRKGINRLLLKVTQGGGGWEFCVRLVDLQGNPIAYREANP
jgi:HEAT repeat protein